MGPSLPQPEVALAAMGLSGGHGLTPVGLSFTPAFGIGALDGVRAPALPRGAVTTTNVVRQVEYALDLGFVVV